jgi:Protein of unknown function (DUF4239)
MLTLAQNFVILGVVMVASLLYMGLINRFWPTTDRYAKEDLVGWQLNILATTYAVILGFMFYTEWTTFVAVKLNVEMEASALQNLYRLSEGLPAAARAEVQTETRAYAAAAVNADWPEMGADHVPEHSHAINQQMWKSLTSVQATTASEAAALDHSLSALTDLTQCRRVRVLQSLSRLPGIFWCVLVVGAILTILSVGTFGSRVYSMHAFQVFSLTLLITLAMLAIADLNRPFQGWVHVDNYAFQRAQRNMSGMPPELSTD